MAVTEEKLTNARGKAEADGRILRITGPVI